MGRGCAGSGRTHSIACAGHPARPQPRPNQGKYRVWPLRPSTRYILCRARQGSLVDSYQELTWEYSCWRGSAPDTARSTLEGGDRCPVQEDCRRRPAGGLGPVSYKPGTGWASRAPGRCCERRDEPGKQRVLPGFETLRDTVACLRITACL